MAITLSLLLLLIANGGPIIAHYMLGKRAGWRVDAGLLFVDHEPLFGEKKTWRGIAVAVAGSILLALLMGYPGTLGAWFAAYSMLGDLISSFIKRRLHIAPSGRATGLDQIPEALLPLWMLRQELTLNTVDIIIVVIAFIVLDRVISQILYHWHIRNRPY